MVVVSDNSPQLTQDEVARMTAAPLHTTKSSGMGLGLILVNSIATGHGGHLSCLPPLAAALRHD